MDNNNRIFALVLNGVEVHIAYTLVRSELNKYLRISKPTLVEQTMIDVLAQLERKLRDRNEAALSDT